jgi:hypothetical protein
MTDPNCNCIFRTGLIQECSVEIISLTPRFNAVKHERTQKNRLNGLFSSRTLRPRLKPGVNEKFSTKQFKNTIVIRKIGFEA